MKMKGRRKLRVGETIKLGDRNKWGFEADISLGDAVSKGEIWYRPIKHRPIKRKPAKRREKVLARGWSVESSKLLKGTIAIVYRSYGLASKAAEIAKTTVNRVNITEAK